MDEPAQVYQVLIKASAQRIWDAITRPEFTARYFYGVRVDTTGEAGTPFRHLSADGTAVLIDETIIEAEAPHKLVIPWRALYSPELAGEPASRVTWLIEEQSDAVCLLTVTHDRLEHAPNTAHHVRGLGWMTVLSGLKTLLETGEPLFPAA